VLESQKAMGLWESRLGVPVCYWDYALINYSVSFVDCTYKPVFMHNFL